VGKFNYKEMKTIIIAHNYSESSFAAMSYHFAHHLAMLGNRVVFISHQPYITKELVIKKGKGEIIVLSWPTTNRPTTLNDFFWFAKLYFKYKPEIVIGHFVGSNITVSVSKILSFGNVKTFEYYHTLSTQILADLHNLTLKQRLFFLRKKVFYKCFCDTLICPSELAKNDLNTFFEIKKGIVLINPMVDRFTAKAVLPVDSIIISYLGRLDSSKGVIDLIYAFEAHKNKFPNSKIILNIAGTGSQKKTIEGLLENNGAINFLGGLSYDKIDDYLNKSHFVIIPSKFDAFNVVGIEAMMNQTPLLISNGTGLSKYLTDEKECYKFDPNIESIIELFGRVEHHFELQEQMGVNARATFASKFTIKNYCDTFSKIIFKNS
jgi:glycosyltransferase involved in cell wall biosynthesis